MPFILIQMLRCPVYHSNLLNNHGQLIAWTRWPRGQRDGRPCLFGIGSIVDADATAAWIRCTSPIPPWYPSNETCVVSEGEVATLTCLGGMMWRT